MTLSKEQHDELAVALAALILYDGDAEINADQINTILEASGNEVEPYWPALFAGLLKNRSIEDLILKPSAGPAVGGGVAAAGGDAAAAGGDAPAKKEEKEEEEEADLSGGMDMFGGGGGGDDY